MNDKDLLKLLGLKDRSINLSLDNYLQKQVEQMVNERLDQIEKQETERREKFYKELSTTIERELQRSRNRMLWYGKAKYLPP